MKHYKTSLQGYLTIAFGIFTIIKGDTTTGTALITAGLGLIGAKDYDK